MIIVHTMCEALDGVITVHTVCEHRVVCDDCKNRFMFA